jgi:hypothetical protein
MHPQAQRRASLMQPTPLLSSMPENLEELASLRQRRESAAQLLRNIKQQLPKLKEMLARVESHWGLEDGFYRFYHQSFKVYGLQGMTEEVCQTLQNLLPDRPLNRWFSEMVTLGSGHEFELSHNQDWLRHTRPILEASFHAHYFLKMVVKYGKELDTPPDCLPNGWAAVLYLFDLR